MSLDAAAQNAAANAIAAITAKVSLHTGDPGAGAANEVSGGSYARMDVAWDPAAGGIAALTAEVSTQVPACTITWLAFWNGATRLGKVQLPAPGAVFPSPGTFRLKTTPTATTIQIT